MRATAACGVCKSSQSVDHHYGTNVADTHGSTTPCLDIAAVCARTTNNDLRKAFEASLCHFIGK